MSDEGQPQPRRSRLLVIQALILSLLSLVALGVILTITLDTPNVAAARHHPSADPSTAWPTTVAVRDLKVGECGLQPKYLAALTYLTVVPCTQRHGFEVYAVFLLPAGPYPGLAKVRRLADMGCAARFRTFVGTDPARSDLDYIYFHPLAGSWNDDQFVHCLVLTSASQRGSVRDLNL